MIDNQYALAKAKLLSGESNLKGSSAFKTVMLESYPRIRPNLAKLVKAWIKQNDIKPLFQNDPCHLVYFTIGHVRLALLSDDEVFRVALESEYNKLERKDAKNWLRDTEVDADIDQPLPGQKESNSDKDKD